MQSNLFLICLLLCMATSHAQPSAYKIDKTNGLPSSHIYGMMKDKHGYLWLSTPKGAVKYNGYDFKVFGQAQGLPSEDVWHTCEDSLGRIWLSTISTEVGYIYNDKYKAAVYAHDGQVLYPKNVTPVGSGIAFLSRVLMDSMVSSHLFMVQGDSVFSFNPEDLGIDMNFISDRNEFVATRKNSVYRIIPTVSGFRKTRIRTYDSTELSKTLGGRSMLLFKQYFLAHEYKGRRVWVLDLSNNDGLRLLPEFLKGDDVINYSYNLGHYFYICGSENIYKFDSTLKMVSILPVSSLVNNEKPDNSKPFLLLEDDVWGNCLGTTSGLYINMAEKNRFIPWQKADLNDCRPVGCINDSVCYWWSNSRNLLIEKSKQALRYYRPEHVVNVKKIVRYDSMYSFLIDEQNVYWMKNDSKEIINFFSNPAFKGRKGYNQNLTYPINAAAISDKLLFGLFRGVKRFCEYSQDNHNLPRDIEEYRYSDIVYDSLRKGLWIYGPHKLSYYDHQKNSLLSISKSTLDVLGIKNIEKVVPDNRYGNLVIRAHDELWLIDVAGRKCRKLFSGYRFSDALLEVYKNTIVVIGRFGILFSKIESAGCVSAPVVYENIRCHNYTDVLGVEISNGKVVLSTDKGLFTVDLPGNSLYGKPAHPVKEKYGLLVSYGERTYSTNRPEAITISQDNMRIALDVVNPKGYGKVSYKYNIKGLGEEWQQLDGNELSLSGLDYNTQYQVSLIAYDDIWQSKPATIKLYIQPYWWQKRTMTGAFVVSGIFALTAIGLGISYITQRIVTRRNARKNFFMALELKGIYSQINPHFIFNTLGTSLYYIKINKTKEAYNHISKFSRLLRTYISSSRNKMITIAEEMQNLKDYIELQQDRFIDRFEYTIHVDEAIDAVLEEIPSLLVQPFVENAINHGLLNKNSKGHLAISFKRESANHILCHIEDNGVGRSTARTLGESSSIRHQSFGNQLIQDLVHIYNTYENIKIHFEYLDKEAPETGTIVKIYIIKLSKNKKRNSHERNLHLHLNR